MLQNDARAALICVAGDLLLYSHDFCSRWAEGSRDHSRHVSCIRPKGEGLGEGKAVRELEAENKSGGQVADSAFSSILRRPPRRLRS